MGAVNTPARWCCEWESNMRVCGNTAEYRDPHGKLLCKMHGEHLIRRFGHHAAAAIATAPAA
jgi:hypothetical protein